MTDMPLGLPPRVPAIAQDSVSEQERRSPGSSEASASALVEAEAPRELDEVTTSQLTSAMRDLEESRTFLRNAGKRLHAAGVSAPLHQNVLLLADAVSEEEARLVKYMGRDE